MEFYIKSASDPHFNRNKLHSESKVAQLMTQLETILFTNKGEVMGDSDFGCDLEDLVFELSYNDTQIVSVITEQIARYCPLASDFNTRVEVSYLRSDDRDAILIDVIIDSQYQMQVVI